MPQMSTHIKKQARKPQWKSAAIVTIRDAAMMTPSGRKNVANWLVRQAKFLRTHAAELSPGFRARYLYADK